MSQVLPFKYGAVASVALTANATSGGLVTVPYSNLFFVGQEVWLSGTAKPTAILQVKFILNETQLYLGLPATGLGIVNAINLSTYTTAASSALQAPEQETTAIANAWPNPMSTLQAAWDPITLSHKMVLGTARINPQFVKVPYSSITGSFATFLTAASNFGQIFILNDLDGIVQISHNGAVMLELAAADQLALDTRLGGVQVYVGDVFQIKYITGASTSGSIRMTLL